MKLLIRNLDRKTTELELNSLFQEYGEVSLCNLVMDKVTNSSKGFGFAEMPNPKEAMLAIKKLNNRSVGANRIRVKLAD